MSKPSDLVQGTHRQLFVAAEFGRVSPLDHQGERYILYSDAQEERAVPMTDKPGDLVQGTLDMLVLKTVALEPTHGYGIAVRIEQMGKGVFRVNAGSLFVAIQRRMP